MNKSVRWIAMLTCGWFVAIDPAQGQTYATRPIKLVVLFGSGSAANQIGRRVAQTLWEALKQPVIVENRPGASS